MKRIRYYFALLREWGKVSFLYPKSKKYKKKNKVKISKVK